MKKATNLLAVVAILGVLAIPCLAWMADRDDVEHTGRHIFTEQGSVDLRGTVKVGGTTLSSTATELNLLDGVTATAAELTAAADLSARVTTASLTNGAALTLSASTPVVVITGIGGANDTTNTVTIATPYPLYQTFTLTVASGSTNLILLADSTTVLALGSNWLADGTDTLTFFTTATNAAVKLSASDN
jgi:hypothetical protein